MHTATQFSYMKFQERKDNARSNRDCGQRRLTTRSSGRNYWLAPLCRAPLNAVVASRKQREWRCQNLRSRCEREDDAGGLRKYRRYPRSGDGPRR